MSVREIATAIVRLRRLLQLGMVAELRDDVDEFDRLLADFDELATALPLHVLMNHGLDRRVVAPSARRARREGILAQAASPDHVHLYLRRDELSTWLCSCGASYMGAQR